MTNSDTTYGIHNKKSGIFNQSSDGSSLRQAFSNVTEAKAFFFTTEALAVWDECCTQLQWALVDDELGNATRLKFTMAFGRKTDLPADNTGNDKSNDWAELYISRQKALSDSDGWYKNDHTDGEPHRTGDFTVEDTDSHLF